MEFGAFVNFLGKQDGLVHISELAKKRVERVGDVVKEGDEVSVKVVGLIEVSKTIYETGLNKLLTFKIKLYFVDPASQLYYNLHPRNEFHQ